MADDTTPLPGGIVTFVFTDIEGSTALFRRLGQRFPPLIERHNQLLRSVWREHNGVEVKTEGDSFFVAFADPTDAVTAAVAGCEAMAAEQWDYGVELRARMGMHSGVAYPRDGDYIAYPVNQAARIGGIGHGGQVVVSPETQEMVGDLGEVELHHLGRYRVRDFDEPVALYQAERSSVPTVFPQLRTESDKRHNLTVREPIIGRDHDIAGIVDQLGQSGLVTIVGPGGVGKTACAHTVATELLLAFTGGVWWVDLSPHRSADEIRNAVADVMEVPAEDLRDKLAPTELLLVLDNAEQAVDATAGLVSELAGFAPQLRVLVSSREPLGIASERVWRLDPLIADSEDAIRIFTERARAADPNFTSEGNDAVIVDLCRKLDGLPLAIEIAAGRLSAMTLGELAESLESSSRLLSSRRKDLADRQRTVEALVGWSYELLEPAEQLFFRRLSVFASSFLPNAAHSTVEDQNLDLVDIADLLWALVEKSLLQQIVVGGRSRYTMLQTIRSFATDRLVAEGEAQTATVQLARFYLHRFNPTEALGRDAALDLGDEIPNISALATRCADEGTDPAQWLAWTLGTARQLTDPLRGLAEVEAIASKVPGSGEGAVGMFSTAAWLAQESGQIERAEQLLETARELAADSDELVTGKGPLAVVLALVHVRNGRMADALETVKRALGSASDLDRSRMLNTAALAEASLGNYEAAMSHLHDALDASRAAGSATTQPSIIGNISELAHRAGDLGLAKRSLAEALTLAEELGHRTTVGSGLVGAARLAAEGGSLVMAVQLNAGGEHILAEAGFELFDTDVEITDQLTRTWSDALGKARFEELSETGRSATQRQLVEKALEILGVGPVASSPSAARPVQTG